MIHESIIAKLIGSFWGAILGLLFYPPKNKFEALRRSAASFISGVIATPILLHYSGWPWSMEYVLASSSLCAFVSWWTLPGVIALLKRIIGQGGDKN